MVEELGCAPYLQKPYKGKRDKQEMNSIAIYKRNDVNKWIKEIGFNNPKHNTKIEVWEKIGYCPPKTKITERRAIING